jgi:hypothetical protein
VTVQVFGQEAADRLYPLQLGRLVQEICHVLELVADLALAVMVLANEGNRIGELSA